MLGYELVCVSLRHTRPVKAFAQGLNPCSMLDRSFFIEVSRVDSSVLLDLVMHFEPSPPIHGQCSIIINYPQPVQFV